MFLPAHEAAVVLASRPALAAACAGAGVRIGNRVELSVAAVVAAVGPEVAGELVTYHRRCRSFWADHGPGSSPGAGVVLERPLWQAVQVDNTSGRRDLDVEFEALSSVGGVGPFVAALCDRPVDEEALARLGAPLGARVTELEGLWRHARFSSEAVLAWPAVLGGAATPGEVRRRFFLRVNHKAWRTHRVRRLVEVAVSVEEIWPRP